MSRQRAEKIELLESELAERVAGLVDQQKIVKYAREELKLQEAMYSGMTNEMHRVQQLLEELRASDPE